MTLEKLLPPNLYYHGFDRKPDAVHARVDERHYRQLWACLLYLDRFVPETGAYNGGSYSAKHCVEELTARGGDRLYISNGALIAALYLSGRSRLVRPSGINAEFRTHKRHGRALFRHWDSLTVPEHVLLVPYPRSGIGEPPQDNDPAEIDNWSVENCPSYQLGPRVKRNRWSDYGYFVGFDTDSEAVAFKLRWC